MKTKISLNKGFTLAEILVVLVIIGVLAALMWPNYTAIKEKTLNREAKATLALIRAAEKIYRMEEGFYYPDPSGTVSDVSSINQYLRVSLPSANRNWEINVHSSNTTGTSARVGGGRVWSIDFPGEGEPTCAGSTYCP